jgi:predicted metal-dependent hydrolase
MSDQEKLNELWQKQIHKLEDRIHWLETQVKALNKKDESAAQPRRRRSRLAGSR